MGGIHAELVVDSPGACPVAAASAESGGPLTGISWTGGEDGGATEQFTAPEGADLEGFDEIFDYGTRRVYEFERDRDRPCLCEFVESSVGPVTAVESRDGAVHLTLLLGSVDDLRTLLPRLQSRYDGVSLEYLVRSRDADEAPVVPVDLEKLTDRQHEVIRTAHRLGYFEYPRESNAQTVAAELGIEPSTFAEHLAAAQSTLLDELLDHGDTVSEEAAEDA